MANENIAGSLDNSQIQMAYKQAQSIAEGAEADAIGRGKFVFFAAFDGTRNDIKDVKLSGNPLDTNVAQLYKQAHKVEESNVEGNLKARYYPGHGTEGALVASDWLPFQVTQETINSAQKAYDQFCREASDWLKAHPGGEVTTAITAFSRGSSTAAVFTHMLYKNGLIDPKDTNKVLIPPGQIGVSAGMIFDPVTTGVDANVAFAPNVKNIAVIRAENEYRYLFKALDYANQDGVKVFNAIGNHCNIGGGYDNGLAALYLEAATKYLQKSGLNINDVDPSRRPDSKTPFLVYDESGTANDMDRNPLNQEQRRGKWDVYAHFMNGAEKQPARLLDKAAQPAQVQQSANSNSISTDFILYNKQHAIGIRNTNEDKIRVYLEKSPEEAIKKYPDLLGALSLKAAILDDTADMPVASKKLLIERFDAVIIANIEQGTLPKMPELKHNVDHSLESSMATMVA